MNNAVIAILLIAGISTVGFFIYLAMTTKPTEADKAALRPEPVPLPTDRPLSAVGQTTVANADQPLVRLAMGPVIVAILIANLITAILGAIGVALLKAME